MIGNNSCGMRSARYGMTIDHVESLDVILSDGSRVLCDARILNIFEGAAEIQAQVIARRILEGAN